MAAFLVRLAREGVKLAVLLVVLAVLLVVRLALYPVQWSTGGFCVVVRVCNALVRKVRARHVLRSDTVAANALLMGVLALCARARTNPFATLLGIGLCAYVASKRDASVAQRRFNQNRPIGTTTATTTAPPIVAKALDVSWAICNLEAHLQDVHAESDRVAAVMVATITTLGTEQSPTGVPLHHSDFARHAGTLVDFAPHADGTYCCHFLLPHATSAAGLQNAVDMHYVAHKHALRARGSVCNPKERLCLVVRTFPHQHLSDLIRELRDTRQIRIATIPRCVMPPHSRALKDTRVLLKRLLELTAAPERNVSAEIVVPSHACEALPAPIVQVIETHNARSKAPVPARKVAPIAPVVPVVPIAPEETAEVRAEREAVAARERERVAAHARTVQINRDAAKRREAALNARKKVEAEAVRRERIKPHGKTATATPSAPGTSGPARPKPKSGRRPPKPPTPTTEPAAKPAPSSGPAYQQELYVVSSNAAAAPRRPPLPPPTPLPPPAPPAPPAPRRDDDDDDHDAICVVCLDAERTHVGSRCYHLALCAACAALSIDRCPLCNAGETTWHRIYR